MPHWVLVCSACHADVNLWPILTDDIAEFFMPSKPDIPSQGLDMRCPNCGHDGVYTRTDILYRVG